MLKQITEDISDIREENSFLKKQNIELRLMAEEAGSNLAKERHDNIRLNEELRRCTVKK
jgi:hypothetical protein